MKKISASATVTINAIAMQKRREGHRVYNFAAGDPVLQTHPKIIDKAIQETQKGVCPYPPLDGLPELKELAAAWINKTCNTQYSKNNVLVTCGGKFALFSVLYSLLKPGNEVLIVAPYWVSYPGMVQMNGGKAKIIETDESTDWKLTPELLIQNISNESKFLIFNNACNPTGAIYSKSEIAALLAVAKEKSLTVISDEVYSGLVYEGDFISCGSFKEYAEEVIVIQSCSKNFGMTGWRVGFVFANESIIKNLTVLQGQSTTGTALMCQWGAVGALENYNEVNSYVKEEMLRRRDLFFSQATDAFKIASRPQSAIYAFMPIEDIDPHFSGTSVAFCEKMISHASVALVPGIAFGIEGYVRFAFSESEHDIKEGLQALYDQINNNR